MDSTENLAEFLIYAKNGIPSGLTIIMVQEYAFVHQDTTGFTDYFATSAPRDWADRYLLCTEYSVSIIPLENKTLLKMSGNMLYTAGMDMKFNKIKAKTHDRIKIEPLEHKIITLSGEANSGIKVYMRVIQAESLQPLTTINLLRLVEEKKISDQQVEQIFIDLVWLVAYLHSQGVQGIKNSIYIKNSTELTFIASDVTAYVHNGVRTSINDKEILLDLNISEFKVSAETRDLYNSAIYGEISLEEFKGFHEGLDEFTLPDRDIDEKERKKEVSKVSEIW